jgi:hypothetical protein
MRTITLFSVVLFVVSVCVVMDGVAASGLAFGTTCATGNQCTSGFCVTQVGGVGLTCGCRNNGDCSGSSGKCNTANGLCKVAYSLACSAKADCLVSGVDCVTQPGAGSTTCGCKTNSDCGGTKVCSDSLCLDVFNTSCTAGSYCSGGNCVAQHGTSDKVCGCTKDNVCPSKDCDQNSGVCRLLFGQVCTCNNDCHIDLCLTQLGDSDKTCGCSKNGDCTSGGCKKSTGMCKHTYNEPCSENDDCVSNKCVSNKCACIPDVDCPKPPVVTSIKRVTPTTKRAPIQSIAVIIYGLYFQTPAPGSVIISATIGGFPCVQLQHISSTELHCSVIGQGANLAVVVVVNGLSSLLGVSGVSPVVRFDFDDVTTSGLSCVPPFGSADVNNPALCNCWSGNAPSDNLLSTDCDVHAKCPAKTTTRATAGEFSPRRPRTNFKDDKLVIKQVVPIVKDRRDTTIHFEVPLLDVTTPHTPAGTVGATTCFFPGTLWAKKINQLDCVEEYHGVVPWSQHVLCGFVEHTDTAVQNTLFRLFKTNMVTTYSETLKNKDGSLSFRRVATAYLLTVSFTRQIQVLTTTAITAFIADQNAPTSLTVVIDGDALYDVASKNTIINFETTMAWPYQIDGANTLTGYWTKAAGQAGDITALATLNTIQGGDLVCDQTQDTECEQSWVLTIDTDAGETQVCNLQGTIEFSTGKLDCRDLTTTGLCPGDPTTNFTISIGATDLCDNAPDVDASAGLVLALDTFYDEDLTVPQAIFQTGDMIYFKLTVTDPISSIDQITFNKIVVKNTGGDHDDLYVASAPGSLALPEVATTFDLDAQFNITDEMREGEADSIVLAPGADGVLTFHFRLLRDKLQVVQDLSTPNDMTEQLTIEATIDLLYHGNPIIANPTRRRSITTNQVPAVTQAHIAFYQTVAEEQELDDVVMTNEVEEVSMFFSSAPVMMVATAVPAIVAAALLML